MFAYCLNNPVRYTDYQGFMVEDHLNSDGELLSSNDLDERSKGGGDFQSSGNQRSPTSNGSPPQASGATNSSNTSGYGRAPKQGVPGSTYTQHSSDGKGTVVSQTTYGAYGAPSQRIDYQGRDHGVGLPHIHVFSWGLRDGNVVPQGESIFAYRL